jgi:Sigma-70 region 2
MIARLGGWTQGRMSHRAVENARSYADIRAVVVGFRIQAQVGGNFSSISGITGYAPRIVGGPESSETNMTSDEALMLEFQGGSRAAFEELFARYREPLYGFFRRRLNSAERADDLTQETFLAVIRASSRYEPRALVMVSVVLFLFSFGPSLLRWCAILLFPARAAWRKVRQAWTAR